MLIICSGVGDFTIWFCSSRTNITFYSSADARANYKDISALQSDLPLGLCEYPVRGYLSLHLYSKLIILITRSVRVESITALSVLLENEGAWINTVAPLFVRCLYQRLFLEPDQRVREVVLQVTVSNSYISARFSFNIL